MPLMVGTPGVIVDSWSDKGSQIFDEAGLGGYVAPLDGSRDAGLCEQIVEGRLGSPEQRNEVARQVQINRDRVRQADALLDVNRYL